MPVSRKSFSKKRAKKSIKKNTRSHKKRTSRRKHSKSGKRSRFFGGEEHLFQVAFFADKTGNKRISIQNFRNDNSLLNEFICAKIPGLNKEQFEVEILATPNCPFGYFSHTSSQDNSGEDVARELKINMKTFYKLASKNDYTVRSPKLMSIRLIIIEKVTGYDEEEFCVDKDAFV
jgi:hypothetical protein